MTRFRGRTIRTQIINVIQTFFRNLWSILTKKEDPKPEKVEHSYSKLLEKFSGLNRIKSMKKKPSRLNNSLHFKYYKSNKHIQQTIKNDYCHKTKTYRRLSHICKSIF